MKASFNVARHSWASLAAREGIPVSVISVGLGHTSEKTTQIYLDEFGQRHHRRRQCKGGRTAGESGKKIRRPPGKKTNVKEKLVTLPEMPTLRVEDRDRRFLSRSRNTEKCSLIRKDYTMSLSRPFSCIPVYFRYKSNYSRTNIPIIFRLKQFIFLPDIFILGIFNSLAHRTILS